ncbi:hypothetical protein DL770_010830 [Monosporascus sp. CRB-9-2]|nr:hypothetical protein DL770_010830 [Monosporascus sp. CRB-9-2]
MATPFMFKRPNLPSKANLPAWFQSASDKFKKLRDAVNKLQKGHRDIADEIGRPADEQGGVGVLAARFRTEVKTMEETEAKINDLRPLLTAQLAELREAVAQNPVPAGELAETLGPQSKDLLDLFVRVFGDLGNLRQISQEHKVELFNVEQEIATRRIAELEDKLLVPRADDGSLAARAELEELRARYTEVEASASDLQARLSRAEDDARKQSHVHAVALAAVHESSRGAGVVSTTKLIRMKQQAAELKAKYEQEISDKEQLLREVVSDRDQHAMAVNSLEFKLRKLKENHSQLGHERDDAAEQADGLELQCQQLEIANAKYTEEIQSRIEAAAELQRQLDSEKEKNAQLTEKLRENTALLTETSNALEVGRIRLDDANKERDQARNNRSLSLVEANRLRTDLQSEKQDRAAEVADLRKKQDCLLAHLGSYKEERDQARKERDDVQRAQHQVLEQLRNAKVERDLSIGEMAHYQLQVKAHIEQLEADVALLVRQAERDHADSLQRTISDAAERENDLRNRVHGHITVMNQRFAALRDRVSDELQGVTPELERLTMAAGAAQREADELQQQIRLLTDEMALAETVYDEQLARMFRQLLANEDRMLDRILGLEGQVVFGDVEHAEQVLTFEGQIQTLQTEKQTLQTEKQTLQTEKQALQTEKQNLQTEKQNLQTEKQTLQTEKQTLQTEKQSLEEEASQKQETIDSLQGTIDENGREAAAAHKADEDRIQNLENQLQTLTIDKQGADTDIETLRKQKDAAEEAIIEIKDYFAHYLAVEASPPARVREPWAALLNSLVGSPFTAPAAPALPLSFWVARRPWLAGDDHVGTSWLSQMGVMNLFIRLYGRVSLNELGGLTYVLLELRAERFRLVPEPQILENVVKTVFAEAAKVLPADCGPETQLFCIGLWQLGTFLRARWGNALLPELAPLEQMTLGYPVYRMLWQPAIAGEVGAVRQLCADQGIVQGNLGLLRLESHFLVVDLERAPCV